ncbi:glycosyltransferase family 4 protein [Halobaculum sp. MBLA0143]|uniref:glycosyltransferase family 4 protein n=1 Tax=Halobaculum sp. MBLA0143 TaxID=3079933 RepID=UPI0035257626
MTPEETTRRRTSQTGAETRGTAETLDVDLAFQTTIDYGGLGRYSVALLSELADRCRSITVYPTHLSVPDPAGHEWWDRVPESVELADRRGLVASYLRDARAFRDHDVVHVNYASLGLPALYRSLAGDTPFVYTLHHYDDPEEIAESTSLRLKYALDLGVCLPAMGRSGRLVTVSEHNRREVRESLGLSPDVVPHGIDPAPYRRVDADGVRAEYGLAEESRLLLFVGKFHGYKDATTVVETFDRLRSEGRDVELVMLSGGGKRDEAVRRRLADSPWRDHTRLVTEVTDRRLYRFYDAADVFTLPSRNEAFGLVFLEAMASGTPVVAVNAGAAPEVVGDAGRLVPPGDTEAFVGGVRDVLDDDDMAAEMCRRGRERVERFSWRRAAEAYVEIYREVLR